MSKIETAYARCTVRVHPAPTQPTTPPAHTPPRKSRRRRAPHAPAVPAPLCSHSHHRARAQWAANGVTLPAGPEPRQRDLSIVSNTFHGKLRLYRNPNGKLEELARLQENDTKLPAKNWRLYDVHVGKGGLSGVSAEGEFAKPKKIFVSTATTCSLWMNKHDPRNFALCSGTLEEGVEVLFISADNEADAALWVSAIAGRLYTNELRIDEDLVVEYIAIFQHFDVDANQRISMEELGAVTRALGKQKSPEELPGMCEELGLNVDAMGLTLPQFMKVCHHIFKDSDPEGELMNAFRVLDVDGNGTLDRQELEKWVVEKGLKKMGDAEVQAFLDMADTNGDGKLVLYDTNTVRQ